MSQAHTLIHLLAQWAKTRANEAAILGKRDGAWESISWSGYFAAVREAAKGFLALGHQTGECIAIVGDNRPEWVICQFGIMAIRGIPAPIYTTNTIEQTAYIVNHCRAKIAICDNKTQLEKYLNALNSGLISVEKIVVMDDLQVADQRVITLSQLRELGRKASDTELDARIAALTEDETALLIYTSGTTGVPKAVQLEHGGMLMVVASILRCFPILDEGPYRAVSYLPLCHVAEQLFTNFFHLYTGGQVYFCPDMKQIRDYLTQARPTVFLGVPRVWEKFQAVLEARFAEATGIKAKLLAWARKTEAAAFKEQVRRGAPYMPFTRKLANKLVLSKIKAGLGLDQLAIAVTGAAPISIETLEFFASIGICVYEGYGMSETTAVSTCPKYLKPVFGSVGKALDGVEVKIADDGEILLRGRNMTRGYLHMPAETSELLDHEHWLHTGDLGSLDTEGNLRITGRKKDLLITAAGKNVAPSEMEGYLKSIPGIGQAVVVGDRQPYLCALLALNPEALPELRSKLGLHAEATLAQIADDPKLQTYLKEQVEVACNRKVARYQTIKKFKVLPVEFTVDGGEMTPTMKIKRNVVSQKYKAEIDALYADGGD